MQPKFPINAGGVKGIDVDKWYIFPESLPNQRFRGVENREDATQLQGAFVVGQNVTFGGTSLPSLRYGIEPVGTQNTDATPVNRAYVFETRAGVQWELKIVDTMLKAWQVGTSTEYMTLLTGLTPDTTWDFANIGRSTDNYTSCMFSNGVDGFYRFSGATATLDSASYAAGIIRGIAINTAGTGYVVGEIITVTGGGGNATYEVTAINTGTGAVTSLRCTNPGSGYSTAAGVATTTSGAGINLVVNITSGTGWIKISGTTNLFDLGFYDSTNSPYVLINGNSYSYQTYDGLFFLGIGSDPTGEAAGSQILQKPEVVIALDDVQGSVIMSHDGRLHCRLDSKASVWNYSKLDDPYDFTATPAGDGIGGSKDVEFGGPIIAFGKLNQTILCFKKRQIKTLSFIQVGARIDSPQYQTLVASDDRGTTLGAVSEKGVFASPLGMIFVTPDKRLVLLSGITANNQPQYVFLSDPIQPIFTNGVFDEAVGIVVDNVIYLAFKQDSTSTFNDTVLRGDMTRQSIDSMGRVLPVKWDAPYVGWNVNDWTVIYNETTGKNEIRFHSSTDSNTYRLIDQKVDNTGGYTGIIRTWSETFDAPQHQKAMDEAFIEIRMNENTTADATILLDEDGYTAQIVTPLSGDVAAYKFGGTAYNPFGASPFGSQKFGSNVSGSGGSVYRFNIELNPNLLFFNAALQISVDGEGQDFELVRFGFHICKLYTDSDRKYAIKPE